MRLERPARVEHPRAVREDLDARLFAHGAHRLERPPLLRLGGLARAVGEDLLAGRPRPRARRPPGAGSRRGVRRGRRGVAVGHELLLQVPDVINADRVRGGTGRRYEAPDVRSHRRFSIRHPKDGPRGSIHPPASPTTVSAESRSSERPARLHRGQLPLLRADNLEVLGRYQLASTAATASTAAASAAASSAAAVERAPPAAVTAAALVRPTPAAAAAVVHADKDSKGLRYLNALSASKRRQLDESSRAALRLCCTTSGRTRCGQKAQLAERNDEGLAACKDTSSTNPHGRIQTDKLTRRRRRSSAWATPPAAPPSGSNFASARRVARAGCASSRRSVTGASARGRRLHDVGARALELQERVCCTTTRDVADGRRRLLVQVDGVQEEGAAGPF